MARRWWVERGEAWTTDSVDREWHGKLLGARVLGVAGIPDSDDCVAVLDWADRPPGVEAWHPYANLVRAGPTGDVAWTAEPPGDDLKSWTDVKIRDGVIVANSWTHSCLIDSDTGHILSSEFTK